jgi:transcriptional regulator with XRE-family HTH domain
VKTYRFKGLQARRRREELGLSAREIASVVDVSESVVCAYERGARQPGGAVYIRLCQALQVDSDELREPREPDAQMSGSAA